MDTLNDLSFPNYVKSLLSDYGVPPQYIGFEISESDAIANLSSTKQLIDELRPLGYSFCLSHFGASLHTFSYLRHLAVDYVKIDGSIVRGVVSNPVDRAIVESIARVARTLGIRTIAMMVEDEYLLESLGPLGVDYVQGYGVENPMPLPLLYR